jgi:hypothetical protein
VKTLTLPNGSTRPATHSLFTMSKNERRLGAVSVVPCRFS